MLLLDKEYKGAILEIKNFKSGYGTKFVVISFKSTFNVPSNLIEQVKLLSKCATILFILSKGFSLYLFSFSPVYVIFDPLFISKFISSLVCIGPFSFTSLFLDGLSI